MPLQLGFTFAQRWKDRREVRREARERVSIDPSQFGVDVIRSAAVAKAYVVQNHYAGSFPASHLCVGLYHRLGVGMSTLVGVAVFSEGIQSGKGMLRWTGFTASEGTELGRLVLAPEVPFNAETWFIKRAFDLLRSEKPRIRAVLSYADPIERRTESGQLVKPGHYGTIYQAANAAFVEVSSPRTHLLSEKGVPLEQYNFYKVREEAKGAAAAEKAIATTSGIARLPGENHEAWFARVKATMRRVRHPGNLTYAFGLDTASWAAIKARTPAMPYPKMRDFACKAG